MLPGQFEKMRIERTVTRSPALDHSMIATLNLISSLTNSCIVGAEDNGDVRRASNFQIKRSNRSDTSTADYKDPLLDSVSHGERNVLFVWETHGPCAKNDVSKTRSAAEVGSGQWEEVKPVSARIKLPHEVTHQPHPVVTIHRRQTRAMNAFNRVPFDAYVGYNS